MELLPVLGAAGRHASTVLPLGRDGEQRDHQQEKHADRYPDGPLKRQREDVADGRQQRLTKDEARSAADFDRAFLALTVYCPAGLPGARVKLYVIDHTDTLWNKEGPRASYVDLATLQHSRHAVPRPVLLPVSPAVRHAKLDARTRREEKLISFEL